MTYLHIEYRPTESLIPCARNARTHSAAQVAQLAASIRKFGFTNPVLVNGRYGIIAGHGRVLAARMLDLDELPVIELAHLTDNHRFQLGIDIGCFSRQYRRTKTMPWCYFPNNSFAAQARRTEF